jgi:hypothetical protein
MDDKKCRGAASGMCRARAGHVPSGALRPRAREGLDPTRPGPGADPEGRALPPCLTKALYSQPGARDAQPDHGVPPLWFGRAAARTIGAHTTTFDNEKCSGCRYVPMCKGGCAKRLYENDTDFMRGTCDYWDNSIVRPVTEFAR